MQPPDLGDVTMEKNGKSASLFLGLGVRSDPGFPGKSQLEITHGK